MQAPASRDRSLLRRLAESAAALALALLLAELGARACLRLPARVQPSSLGLKELVADELAPGMGECLVRGGQAAAEYPTADGGLREVRYRTSADGFRDRVYPRERQPGNLRLALLGDSVTFGFGINEEDTLPRQLERELNARFDGRIEVMNCGIYSFNATQQAAHLRYRVADFHPDLVLFVTTVTDASGGDIVGDERKHDTWEVRWTKRLGLTSGRFSPAGTSVPPAQRRMLALRQRSALVDYLANRTFTWMHSRVMSAGYLRDWLPGSPGRAAVAAAYADARALGAERGFEVQVALYPVLDRLDDYALGPVTAAVREICAQQGLAFHDLLPALAGQDARALQAHAHDKHPNGRANRLVAVHLARELGAVVARGLGE